jgi:hypothetical protein
LTRPPPACTPQPLPDVPAALAWLDTEHPALLAAQHAAARHIRHPTVWQLAWNLDTFHARRGYGHDRFVMWRAALDAAAHLADPTTRIVAHRHLGSSYAALNCHDEGISHLRQALALAEECHDPDQQALQHATRARNLFRTLNQPCASRAGPPELLTQAPTAVSWPLIRALCSRIAASALSVIAMNPSLKVRFSSTRRRSAATAGPAELVTRAASKDNGPRMCAPNNGPRPDH